MKEFAHLLENLVHTPQRNGKMRILTDYFARIPDPERGWTVGILAGTVDLPGTKAAMIRNLVESRVDPVLFQLSYDYVGDLAETVSLIWPDTDERTETATISTVISILQHIKRKDIPDQVAEWLNCIPISERFALLKLIMGGLRVGVSARLAKLALAEFGDKAVADIEEMWFGLQPPYEDLFQWLEDKGPPPRVDDRLAFRPPMLANPIEQSDFNNLKSKNFVAEWKWDGIRVLFAARDGETRLYSRSGDDIGRAFPDILEIEGVNAVLDGELLVAREGVVAPFAELQRRIGRKTASAALQRDFPAHLRVYDLLFDGDEDLRPLPLHERRARLEHWYAAKCPERIDLSLCIAFKTWDQLARLRDGAREAGIEGIMLKHRDSPYVAGRPKGPWLKWKRDPLLADCVLMYAQRGHGKRSSYYSDYTFGCWRPVEDGSDELVPVGKAYSGFTNDELAQIDRWVRNHVTERFGPVRAVEPGLVFEVAFDSVHPSTRHKSGIAMRFPRIHRIRWDKPPEEADRVEALEKLIDPPSHAA